MLAFKYLFLVCIFTVKLVYHAIKLATISDRVFCFDYSFVPTSLVNLLVRRRGKRTQPMRRTVSSKIQDAISLTKKPMWRNCRAHNVDMRMNL